MPPMTANGATNDAMVMNHTNGQTIGMDNFEPDMGFDEALL